VAVSAGGQAGHHGAGLGLVDVTELPLDFGEDGIGEGFDDAALGRFGRGRDERDVAIEKGSADGVAGGLDCGLLARERLLVSLGCEAADDHGCGRGDGMLFDLVPGFRIGTPGVGDGFLWRERWWDVAF